MQLESLRQTAQRWLKSTQKALSQPPKVLISRPDETFQASTGSNRVFWVISRRITRQTVFTLPPDIPENKREAMLRLQIRRWAPFPSAKHIAQWSGNRASVFAWDDNAVKKTISDAGLNPRRCTIYPETFFRAPLQNGARLVAAIEGIEGQVWQDGFLVASRWWPQKPGRVEWDMFLRATSQPLGQSSGQVPEAEDLPFLEAPWNRGEGYFGIPWWLIEDPRFVTATAVLALAPFVFLGAQYVTLAASQESVRRTLEDTSAATQNVRKQRNEALANLDEIDSYLGLEIYPSQYRVLAKALELLEPLSVKIPEWTYDVGTLTFSLRADHDIDATGIITAFEQSGVFTNVSATRFGQEGQLRVRMDVLPKDPNVKPMKTGSK